MLCLVCCLLLEVSCLQPTIPVTIQRGCGLRAFEIAHRSAVPRCSKVAQMASQQAKLDPVSTFCAASRVDTVSVSHHIIDCVVRLRRLVLCVRGCCFTLLRVAILQAAVLLSVVFVGPTLARAGVKLDAECTPDVKGLQTYTEPVRFCETPTPISGRTSIRFLQVRRAPSGSAHRPACMARVSKRHAHLTQFDTGVDRA